MQRIVEGVASRFSNWNSSVLDLSTHRRRLLARLSDNQQQDDLIKPKLEELVILELTEDGGRQYHHFTVRELYNHVMKSITNVPNANPSYSESSMPLVPGRSGRVSVSDGSGGVGNRPHERIEVFDSLQSHVDVDSPTSERKRFPVESSKVTYRERLGGHLHPRDMRRMVIPFSRSNEPALIVRRHAMLLNFDPLRAIILRDRLLVLVPDGADSVLENLEGRLRGGLADVEHDVFGDSEHHPPTTASDACGSEEEPLVPSNLPQLVDEGESALSKYLDTFKSKSSQNVDEGLSSSPKQARPSVHFEGAEDEEDEDHGGSELDFGELNELEGRTWINLPFELQCVDAVLHSITDLLASQASDIQDDTLEVIERLLDPNMGVGEFAQEILRTSKNNVNEMVSRLQWFMRALTQVLNEDEDMALMNLSRLISHPELFIQPVPAAVLEEESDEPELILEAYLQQAVALTTELDLMKGQLQTTEELMNMKSDTIRNKILYINMIITIIMVALTLASLVAGFFGMNTPNRLNNSEHEWIPIVAGSVAGGFVLVVVVIFLLRRWGIVYSTV